ESAAGAPLLGDVGAMRLAERERHDDVPGRGQDRLAAFAAVEREEGERLALGGRAVHAREHAPVARTKPAGSPAAGQAHETRARRRFRRTLLDHRGPERPQKEFERLPGHLPGRVRARLDHYERETRPERLLYTRVLREACRAATPTPRRRRRGSAVR